MVYLCILNSCCLEPCKARSTTPGLRENWTRSALLCRVRKVSTLPPLSVILHPFTFTHIYILYLVFGLTHVLRYYETDNAIKAHWKTKIHKKRCKNLREPAYTIEESERAAGLGKEGKRPSTTLSSTLTPEVVMAPTPLEVS
jgi:hypothetical protein